MRTLPRSVVSVITFTVKSVIVFLAGLALIAGAAWWVVRPVARQSLQQQIFTVQGTAKKYVSPDTAIVQVGNELNGSNPAKLQQEAERAVNKAKEQLVAAGLDQDGIRTSQYNLAPQYDYTSGQRKFKDEYTVTIELEVRTQKLDLVGKVIDIAVANNLNRINGVQFLVKDQDAINKALREEAVQDAKDQAKELAKISDIHLGKVINIVEGSYPVPMYYNQEDVALGNAGTKSSTPSTPTTTINPGQTEVQLTVTLYYEVN